MENEENFDLYLDSRVIIYYTGWGGWWWWARKEARDQLEDPDNDAGER